MFLEESPEQQQLRAELRGYYAELLTDEVRAGLAEGGEGGDAWREVVRQIGKDGWLGIGWPTEFGGQGRPATDQFIFFDETRRAGAPFPFVTINTVGPTIMRFGTDEQKSFFLPEDPRGRAQLRHRLHRARGRHRPGLVAHPGRARRRGVRRQRGQDLHVGRRPWPTTSGWPCAPTPTCPSTRASRSCACRRRRPASSGRSSTPSAG